MSAATPTRLLLVQASGRRRESQSRALSNEIAARLKTAGRIDRVIERDLADGIEFVDEDWIAANFTPEEQRTDAQRQRLAGSDALVDELAAADILVIATPIYNFGVPAVLKAWIDQVARARKTFRYTEQGPRGLLEGKKAYVVIASGGTKVGSEIDFVSGYLRHVLGFLGIHDVSVIAADRLNATGEKSLATAHAQIESELAEAAAA